MHGFTADSFFGSRNFGVFLFSGRHSRRHGDTQLVTGSALSRKRIFPSGKADVSQHITISVVELFPVACLLSSP